MTDTSKYKTLCVPIQTHDEIDQLRKGVIVPNMTISRSQTVTLLVTKELKSLNGKLKGKKKI